MNFLTKALVASLAVAAGAFGILSVASAQMAAVMPAIYNQYGSEANAGSARLAAGYYYLGGGLSMGGHQIEYFGNGTFYDSTYGTYGGSISDPNGTAGVTLGYGTTAPSGGTFYTNGRAMATMPALYNQNSSEVNQGSGYLTAGYYRMSNGVQVYYYGNGTFYDPSVGIYGGSINNLNGMAGVSLGYAA